MSQRQKTFRRTRILQNFSASFDLDFCTTSLGPTNQYQTFREASVMSSSRSPYQQIRLIEMQSTTAQILCPTNLHATRRPWHTQFLKRWRKPRCRWGRIFSTRSILSWSSDSTLYLNWITTPHHSQSSSYVDSSFLRLNRSKNDT